MKFNCGPTWEERYKMQRQWHRWFAWRPVRVASGDCRWLEYVERRYETPERHMSFGTWWKYRPLGCDA